MIKFHFWLEKKDNYSAVFCILFILFKNVTIRIQKYFVGSNGKINNDTLFKFSTAYRLLAKMLFFHLFI